MTARIVTPSEDAEPLRRSTRSVADENAVRRGSASRPPRRRRASPATSPSRARSARARSASSRRRRNHGRDASGSPASGGMVISPRIDGYAREPARDLLGRDARLRRLAGEVDLEQRGDGQPPRGRVGVERVHELADPVHDLHLVRLQVADEMPAKRVAVDARACARGPGRGSPRRPRRPPRRARRARSSGTYFVATTTVTRRTRPPRGAQVPLAERRRRSSASSPRARRGASRARSRRDRRAPRRAAARAPRRAPVPRGSRARAGRRRRPRGRRAGAGSSRSPSSPPVETLEAPRAPRPATRLTARSARFSWTSRRACSRPCAARNRRAAGRVDVPVETEVVRGDEPRPRRRGARWDSAAAGGSAPSSQRRRSRVTRPCRPSRASRCRGGAPARRTCSSAPASAAAWATANRCSSSVCGCRVDATE